MEPAQHAGGGQSGCQAVTNAFKHLPHQAVLRLDPERSCFPNADEIEAAGPFARLWSVVLPVCRVPISAWSASSS